MLVYADNAATTKTSAAATRVMLETMEKFYANPSSLHEEGQNAKEKLDAARAEIAETLNAKPNEIYFTSGGSESDNQAIISAAYYGEKKGKKKIISTAVEHHAVLNTLLKLEKQGFNIEILPVNEYGAVSAEQVRKAVTPDVCLVSVMYANNEIGTINPIREIGEICREKGVVFHTDAVQAAGHIPIDVVKDNIDMLSLSGHKFHGPKGTGVLYVKTGVRLASLIEGGAQENGKRAGTENMPAIAGMAVALKDAVRNMQKNSEKVIRLRNKLIAGLEKIPCSVLNGDPVNRLPGNVSFCFEGVEGEALLLYLSDKGICASSGSACTSGSLDPSHVLLAIGRTHEIAHGSLRLSLSEYNTESEVDYMLAEIPATVEKLRGMSPLWQEKLSGERKFILGSGQPD